jgi:hypothetical protein
MRERVLEDNEVEAGFLLRSPVKGVLVVDTSISVPSIGVAHS